MEYWLFGTGALILVWTWFMVRRGYLAGWERLEASRRQLEEQVAELTLVAEDVLADVRDRTERLQQLLDKADAVLGGRGAVAPPAAAPVVAVTYESSAAYAASSDRIPDDGTSDTAEATEPPAVLLLSALEAVRARMQQGTDQPAPTTSVSPASPAAPASPASPASRHRDVWELAEQGHTVPEIARRTQKTQGEIELILGLRKLG